jgi:hypothetical protein
MISVKKKFNKNYCESCKFKAKTYKVNGCTYTELNNPSFANYMKMVDSFNKKIKCPWYKKNEELEYKD